jgi:hypothetical protein
MSAGGGRLRPKDGLRVASVGLRARPLRAALSALGIAIGTAAIVGVLGLSSSSQAGLIAEINQLGTNLLTVAAGQSLTGGPAQLPREAPARITLLDNVQQVAHTALMKDEKVYRSSMIPVGNTGGLQVRATSLSLLSVLGTGVARGDWLNEGTAREPVAVLGSVAAHQLGIDRVYPDQRIWLGGQWVNVAGILSPSPLAPDIDNSALIGLCQVGVRGGLVRRSPCGGDACTADRTRPTGKQGHLWLPADVAVPAVAVRSPLAFRFGTTRCLRTLERVAALDEGEGGAGGPVGGDADGVGSLAVLAVEEQRGVAVRGGFKDSCERVGGGGIAVADLGDQGVEGIDGLVGAFELGVAALVDARVVERLEQRALLGGEADVGAGHRGESLLWALGVGDLGGEHLREAVQGAHRDRGEQCVAVGEVPVGGGDGDAEATARLGEGEAAEAALGDQVDRGIDERRREVAVVVAAAFAGRLRRRR